MAQDSYSTILAPATAELVEKRSRFLCEIRPMTSEAEATAFVAEKRALHHDARHHCSAWILREKGILRYADDGEPQGTAGMPMLEVLRREGLTDIAAVVTRYFGGTLLGAGGLSRAYSHSVKMALDAAIRVRMCLCHCLLLEIPYTFYDRMVLLLQSWGAEILDTNFGTEVVITARLQVEKLPGFEAALTELSGGSIVPVVVEQQFAPVRQNN